MEVPFPFFLPADFTSLRKSENSQAELSGSKEGRKQTAKHICVRNDWIGKLLADCWIVVTKPTFFRGVQGAAGVSLLRYKGVHTCPSHALRLTSSTLNAVFQYILLLRLHHPTPTPLSITRNLLPLRLLNVSCPCNSWTGLNLTPDTWRQCSQSQSTVREHPCTLLLSFQSSIHTPVKQTHKSRL